MSVLDDFFGDSSNDDYISPDTLEKADERRQRDQKDRQDKAAEIYTQRRRKHFDRTGLTNWEINLMIEFGFAEVVSEQSWKFVFVGE